MAFFNGEWLKYDERADAIRLLRENIKIYHQLMKAGEMTEADFAQLEADLDDLERLERVHRGEHDMLFFMYEYFSEERNPGNPDNLIPAGVTIDQAPWFHQELCRLLDEISCGKVHHHVAWSVGRQHAKTAYLSNGFLCHEVVYRLRKYIVLVSETTDVAGDFITWTANQLKHNQKLRQDFGELLNPRKVMNEADNRYEFITSSGTKVEAKGVGTQMRGLRHGATRPDLFLLDDLESKKNTNTPELRKQNKDWFREEMLQALSKDGGICVYMGTIVHHDSLLNYVIKERKDFVSRKFPAILKWSERQDLWQKWREIYREDAEDSVQRADAFFEANKEEMLRGTAVLWEARWSYLDLMKVLENEGSKAFNQEYMCNPINEESQVFKPEDMYFYREEELPDILEYYAGVDFAMGKEKGDYSAIIVVGKSPNGIFYVVDTYVERVHPDVLLEKIVEKALEWQLAGIGVEAQQAQEWFADKVTFALQAAGYPGFTRLKPITQRNRKSLRIESMAPDIQAGRIRFRKDQRLLLEMLELYPSHDHDDAPDALHMALSVAKSNQVVVRNARKRMR